LPDAASEEASAALEAVQPKSTTALHSV